MRIQRENLRQASAVLPAISVFQPKFMAEGGTSNRNLSLRKISFSMRRFLLLPLLPVFMASCSPNVEVPATMPEDFSLTYHWQEGSLPPPYHYEYTITIQPDGQGQIEMIPDYVSDQIPVWTEEFILSSAELDQLYETLLENNFFQTNWKAQSDPPIGGSSDSLVVTSRGREIEIPSFVLPAQQEAQSQIVAAINSFVPATIWEELDLQREQYMEDHQD